ncbi:hypothetical protein F1536_00565 [Achromobacter xylosoxidans]|uniref:hypothetical protein n=1 Tax=Alcaligenes xylosoxydans xylosoxydans TaxID=85698 RepID=UPI001232620A|nr:hypothetical protein [Achromobacter xylosoxidans]KAA5924220.1 hypothetical protein F1536_00565 [Achromobacter xylosoxidans]
MDQENRKSQPLYAVFLGGPLHGQAVALKAPGTPRHTVGMHETVTGYRLAPKKNGALASGDQEERYFYLADDLFPGLVPQYVAEFWAMASRVPDA